MKCMHCGHDISDTAKFCAFCGGAQKIEASVQPGAPASPVTMSGPEAMANQPVGNVEINRPDEVARAAAPIQPEAPASPVTMSGPEGIVGQSAPVASPQGGTSDKKGRTSLKRFLLPSIILLAALLGTGIYIAGQMGGGPTGTDDSYKEKCISMDIDKLSKDPDKYKGEDIHVYGEVFAIMEEDGQRYLAIDTVYDEKYDMYYGGTIVLVDDGAGLGDVEEWDRIDVYGRVTGETKEAKTPILTVEAPLLKVKVVKKGH